MEKEDLIHSNYPVKLFEQIGKSAQGFVKEKLFTCN
jgi:hypothetical protein